MKASPFLFLSKPKNVDLLAERLRELDVDLLRAEDSDSAYHPGKVFLSHASIATFAIVFHRSWWTDGMHQEDDKICLSTSAAETLICDVTKMLRSRFPRPLPEVIIDQVTEAVARLIAQGR